MMRAWMAKERHEANGKTLGLGGEAYVARQGGYEEALANVMFLLSEKWNCVAIDGSA